MVDKEVKIGIAMRNFTAFPELPDAQALIEYGVKMETLGFESLWVWDHILLGVEPHFPIIESLSLLTAVAARTDKIKLGTGVLVLPLRNPLVLAKQLSSIDQISQGRLIVGMASGWYKREFDAVGVPFEKRGNIMDQNIEIMNRLWTEDMVRAEYGQYNLRNSVMFPKPVQQPRPQILIGGYVDRVLKRAGQKGDGWLTYFYTPESFTASWEKVCRFAEEAGRDPASLESTNQLPIMVGGSRSEVEGPMNEWLNTEWDYADWSDSTAQSAIMGTADECVEQIQVHIATGVNRLIFVPYKYEMEQVDILAKEIVPRLKGI
ncbi:MAG: TIGR03619 family F420-dependent LLM class oxidoreductase [Nitrospinaceae bacterium]|jgi:probable F420-dependent oxidoreductase|nr:TIGR03619 family F420-dependent LLM class oxidoreductase [Nitrospinaceae bacterium]MBT3433998.1 TIGR03619 family F420-dependent LLM class oxidoreductase [Nitrospinaceae bacterium]MBT3820359.1 TIGR03619 family F420-dependent LLM class oxidoreductase [Nitrospinaceae bacterium]MBT4094189.1 TIGR03619 family F420-dependent LLM class oxidoreductase [Nitrospinaceae bacterium]MBT5949181.1 TIGR03619 family F420-dependent LLM class oxidoreductase [Nitrospinaceae bacterium]